MDRSTWDFEQCFADAVWHLSFCHRLKNKEYSSKDSMRDAYQPSWLDIIHANDLLILVKQLGNVSKQREGNIPRNYSWFASWSLRSRCTSANNSWAKSCLTIKEIHFHEKSQADQVAGKVDQPVLIKAWKTQHISCNLPAARVYRDSAATGMLLNRNKVAASTFQTQWLMLTFPTVFL